MNLSAPREPAWTVPGELAQPSTGLDQLRAPAELISFLADHGCDIVDEWVMAASSLGPNYRRSSLSQLQDTIGQSFHANLVAMAEGRTRTLDVFVEYITTLRLEAGFGLSEVQKAFDLFRIIVMRRLGETVPQPWLGQALNAINACVSYQIHRFSDKFQAMHNAAIQRHAHELERKVEERSRALETSQRRYKTLVEEINDGYFAVVEGRIAFANRAFCSMHRAQNHHVQSQLFSRFVAEEDRGRVDAAYARILSGHKVPRSLEYQRLALDGGRGATEIRARVVDLGQGPMLIGICRDITARVAMEEKVRNSERMAYVGQLAASLSHEIRNPLSTINMNLQIMGRKPYLEPVDRERLEMAASEVSRLERLLHQLLDLSKPLAPAPGPMDLNALAADAIKLLAPKLAKRGIRVRRHLDRGLASIRADRGMLEQALFNLLLNAMDALIQGGHITVGTRVLSAEEGKQPPSCQLWVRDNGSGLGQEEMGGLFTPFYTNKPHGTGLGLTNVKRIVEAHHGSIAVTGAPGKGACFTITLPVDQP